MSNKGRVLTLVVEITDDEGSEWIWDAHLNGAKNGVKVRTITEGNAIMESEMTDEEFLEII